MTNCRPSVPRYRAFTLIELLIVVAIIAILAAIAVPNFLEAQTRSKVSRVRSDMRTASTALESYHIDHNVYPAPHEKHNMVSWDASNAVSDNPFHSRLPSQLTTPIAYLSTLPNDPFRSNRIGVATSGAYLRNFNERFIYFNFPFFQLNFPGSFAPGAQNNFAISNRLAGDWLFYSVGPGGDEWNRVNPASDPLNSRRVYIDYDPTNGTMSQGNIFRTQRSGEQLGVDPFFLQ